MLAKDATKALRETAGLTQEAFAKRLECTREHVTQVELGGRRFGPEIILRIGRRFRKQMHTAGVMPTDFMRI